MRHIDIAIIGAGHAGLNALKAVRRTNSTWVMISAGELGTTCAQTGCMPSKVIIELAHRLSVKNEGRPASKEEIDILMEEVRDMRDLFVDLILENTTDTMKEGEELLLGEAKFLSPTLLNVNGEKIKAKKIIIATGSSPIIPKSWEKVGDRLLSSETLFNLTDLPNSIAVIGMGPIGLEIGQALHRLGVHVTGFDEGNAISCITDPMVNKIAIETFTRDFPINLGSKVNITPDSHGVRVSVNDVSITCDKIFVAVGRKPNIPKGLKDFCEFDAHGVPKFDERTLQIHGLPVFIAGDALGTRMLLQDAAEEGIMAGTNATRNTLQKFKRKTQMSISFSDPNIAHIGATLKEVPHAVVGHQRFGPIGRALIMGRNRGVISLYADPATSRLLGAAMVGPRVEHLAHLIGWAIQQKMTIQEMIDMPFYHPVIEEALQDALHQTEKKLNMKNAMTSTQKEGN